MQKQAFLLKGLLIQLVIIYDQCYISKLLKYCKDRKYTYNKKKLSEWNPDRLRHEKKETEAMKKFTSFFFTVF